MTKTTPPTAALAAACALSALSAPVPASAQDADEILTLPEITVEGLGLEDPTGPVDGYLPERTTTGTRLDAPIDELPLSIQSIPREVIEDTNATRLRDVIGFATGSATGNVFGGANDNFLFRGFGAQVATDGIATGALGGGVRTRDSANLERVEVLRGPASALYGQGAPGGVVNLVRKRPFDAFAATFDTSVSSLTRLRQEADVNVPLSDTWNLNGRMVAAVEGTDSFRFRAFTDAFPENRVVVAPSLSFSPTPDTDVVINTEYTRDASLFDRGLPLDEGGGFLVDIDQTFADTDVGNTITQTAVASVEATHRFSDAVSLRLAGGIDYNRFEGTQSEAAFLSTLDVPDPIATAIGLPEPLVAGETILRELEFRDFENVNANVQSDLNLSFATGPLSHDALISVEYARAEEDDFASRSDIDGQFDLTSIDTPNRPTALSREDLPVISDRLGTTETVGLVVFDKISYGEWVHLLLGGRVDFLEQSGVNEIGEDPRPLEETAFSPRAGVVVRPLDDLPLSTFFSYGESFQANTGVTPSGALLDPQEGRVFEGGLRYDFFEDERLALTVTAFDISLDNAPVVLAGTAFSTTSTQESRGVEIALQGAITPRWSVLASYTFTDAETTEVGEGASDLEVGEAPPGVAEHTASLVTRYAFAEGTLDGLSLTGALQMVGERRSGLATEAPNPFAAAGIGGPTLLFDAVDLDPFVRVDVGAAYDVTDDIRVEVGIRNLLNQEIAIPSTSQFAIPDAPITGFAGLRVRF